MIFTFTFFFNVCVDGEADLHSVVVDAVLSLDQDDLNEKLIGVKKVTGGGLQDSLFVNGVAFKKT